MAGHRSWSCPTTRASASARGWSSSSAQLLDSEGDRLHITARHPAFVAYIALAALAADRRSGSNLPSRSRKPKRLHQAAALRKMATRANASGPTSL